MKHKLLNDVHATFGKTCSFFTSTLKNAIRNLKSLKFLVFRSGSVSGGSRLKPQKPCPKRGTEVHWMEVE